MAIFNQFLNSVFEFSKLLGLIKFKYSNSLGLSFLGLGEYLGFSGSIKPDPSLINRAVFEHFFFKLQQEDKVVKIN